MEVKLIWDKSHYLPRCLHSLPEAEVNDGENEKKAEHELPANSPDVPQPGRLVDLQDISPVKTKQTISSSSKQEEQNNN